MKLLEGRTLFTTIIDILGVIGNSFNRQSTVLFTFFHTFDLFLLDVFCNLFGPNVRLSALSFRLQLDVFSFLRVSDTGVIHDRYNKHRWHDDGGRSNGYEALRKGLLGK